MVLAVGAVSDLDSCIGGNWAVGCLFRAGRLEQVVTEQTFKRDRQYIAYNNSHEIDGVKLELTCGACPEQYDAYIGDERVGYLRLRHGWFYVECPDCGGETVYESEPKGDGLFDDDEREFYLREAVAAIKAWKEKQDA